MVRCDPTSRWPCRSWWLSAAMAAAATLISAGITVGEAAAEIPVTRIAFGSCANQSAPQPIWDSIIDFDPQVFIWMGDNIYGDKRRPFKLFGKERTVGPWKNVQRFYPASEQEMELDYKRAKSNPGYSRLRQKAKVIGTWDDHDYGLNDAGKEFSAKVTNQRLHLDFLDEPQDSPRRKQEGVYGSFTFGSTGKQIKVIILDTRYHRDPINSDGTILGTTQWSWLEKEMKGPATEITIIVSSIQVISNHTATMAPLFYMEGWGRFPKESDRLFKLISESKRNGVFFISGDVHFGEISRFDCGAKYPLYEFTSSGLTQAVEKVVPHAFRSLIRGIAWLTPATMRLMSSNCRYSSCTYGKPNFGTIEINWNESPVKLKIEVRDVEGYPVAGVNVYLSELQVGNMEPAAVSSGEFRRHCSLEVNLPWFIRYRLVILFCCFLGVYFLIVLLLLLHLAVRVRGGHLSKIKSD
ncbi:hypothetical protein SAY86_028395 [Trapa natans]|uniref:PhoD-like phosphatase metallophosphatase domain-containing protein n=1 Tax=Trapa natans TaxID=22666 RepID=A0AAN7R8K9_TRANT|nr:hypothetical protein SAY86_028395 [Trapa natans]